MGTIIVIIGAQWGDEGKGKIVDELAGKSDLIIRFQGGPNAGHTIVVTGVKTALHVCPSGILRAGKVNIVGPGVLFELVVGTHELGIANDHDSIVLLDFSTPIVLPIHRVIDAGREAMAHEGKIGTTKRGIGPAYSDHTLRRGLTLGDLHSKNRVRVALSGGGYWNELVALCKHFGIDHGSQSLAGMKLPIDPLSLDATIDWCMGYADQVTPHLEDTRAYVHNAIDNGKNLLFEGAQGVMLDVYHGARPFTTSSSCTPAAIAATFGVYRYDRVLGIAKAYLTRVGAGPMPTELFDSNGERLRQVGAEFGTTTGRDRRTAWHDTRQLRFGKRVAGLTEIVVTKLDVLSGMPELYTGEEYEGISPTATLTREVLEKARSTLKRHQTWNGDISHARCLGDLPEHAQAYLSHLEQRAGVPISGVSVGPGREAIFWN